MNKLSKIFLSIIIILAISLGIMTYLYFDMRKTAQTNLDAYVDVATKLVEINSVPNSNQVIDYVKAIEDPEERAMAIKVYLENGDLTPEVANELY